MWNLGVSKHFANPNSLGEIHKKRSKKERLISIVSRNLRKIWHNEWLEDPIWDLLKELSERTWNNYNSLEDLDEVTLEWISHASVLTIHELCENVKDETHSVIQEQKKML